MKINKIGMVVLAILILASFFTGEKTYAAEHKLEKLHIHVFINKDGSARITENRIANLSEGTENYIVIGNLGKSKIKDFVVKEDGKTYQYVNKWDLKASRSEKALKNGIIETKGGYELSWGIGEYGKHEYTVEYTVTNFIKQLQDSQILFWRFVNDKTNIPPEAVTVEIETEIGLSEENEKIWGFGFTGKIGFYGEKVMATSSQPLSQNDYVTILVKFSDGMFSTDDFIDQPFEEIKDKAFEGSDYGKDKGKAKSHPFIKNIFIILLVVFIISDKLFRTSQKLTNKKARKFYRKFRGEYYRDVPYEGNFLDIYYILYIMGVSNFEKLLTSFILKWVNEEKILVETKEEGFFNKKDAVSIYFFNKEMNKESNEGKLFHMMLSAAGSNDVLEQNEFTVWAEKNKKKLINWERNIINESISKLDNLGYVSLQIKKRFFVKKKTYELTEKGQILEEDIYKYVNYLNDYSLLNEHEAVNVKIWDQIMIVAALLGLTDVVRKQFISLYPKYVQETVYSDSSLNSTPNFSSSASKARSSSSGSGGSTSSGGGGGSFGGGSGGGTR